MGGRCPLSAGKGPSPVVRTTCGGTESTMSAIGERRDAGDARTNRDTRPARIPAAFGPDRPGDRGTAGDGRPGAVAAQQPAVAVPRDAASDRAARRSPAEPGRCRPRRPRTTHRVWSGPVQPPAGPARPRHPADRHDPAGPGPARPPRGGPARRHEGPDPRTAGSPACGRIAADQPPSLHRCPRRHTVVARPAPRRARRGGLAARRAGPRAAVGATHDRGPRASRAGRRPGVPCRARRMDRCDAGPPRRGACQRRRRPARTAGRLGAARLHRAARERNGYSARTSKPSP